MYTGITQGLFPVVSCEQAPGLLRYQIALPSTLRDGLAIGASISINGVCQTVVGLQGDRIQLEAMQETLNKTTLNELTVGAIVSVERSAKIGDDIGGHEMAGHIYGTGVISARHAEQNNLRLTIQVPAEWMRFIIHKGFIGVDGSSLTVGDTDTRGFFNIHLIPQTLRVTQFGQKKIGDRVNIEFDSKTQLIVETVERIMATQTNKTAIC